MGTRQDVLTDDQVRHIKSCLIAGYSPRELGELYDRSVETIRRIKRREIYRHVVVEGEGELAPTREPNSELQAIPGRPPLTPVTTTISTPLDAEASARRLQELLAQSAESSDRADPFAGLLPTSVAASHNVEGAAS